MTEVNQTDKRPGVELTLTASNGKVTSYRWTPDAVAELERLLERLGDSEFAAAFVSGVLRSVLEAKNLEYARKVPVSS